jgi:hypothetical protein
MALVRISSLGRSDGENDSSVENINSKESYHEKKQHKYEFLDEDEEDLNDPDVHQDIRLGNKFVSYIYPCYTLKHFEIPKELFEVNGEDHPNFIKDV